MEINPPLLAWAVAPPYLRAMENPTGAVIRAALKRLGKTQRWLAEELDVSDVAVSKWVQTGVIARENLVPIARALDISVDELLTGEMPPYLQLWRDVAASPAYVREAVAAFADYLVHGRPGGAIASPTPSAVATHPSRFSRARKTDQPPDDAPPDDSPETSPGTAHNDTSAAPLHDGQ